MSIWKKSDDPWDIDPQKARARQEKEAGKEAGPGLFSAVKEWEQKRKAEREEREAALAAEPLEKCPWCGKDMERGYLRAGRGGISWTPGRPTARSAWIGPPKEIRERQLRVDHEGDFICHKTAWYCKDCAKMVMDTVKMPYFNGDPGWPETEFDQELEKYARQAQEEGGSGEEGDAP